MKDVKEELNEIFKECSLNGGIWERKKERTKKEEGTKKEGDGGWIPEDDDWEMVNNENEWKIIRSEFLDYK